MAAFFWSKCGWIIAVVVVKTVLFATFLHFPHNEENAFVARGNSDVRVIVPSGGISSLPKLHKTLGELPHMFGDSLMMTLRVGGSFGRVKCLLDALILQGVE